MAESARRTAYEITRNAADKVNSRWAATADNLVTAPVRAMPWDERGPFSFEIAPEQAAMLTEEQKDEISQMCREEIKSSLARDPQALGGLIIGYAKEGENFFSQ